MSDDTTTLHDGTVVRCRQDSSTIWIIYEVPKDPGSRSARMVGTEKPTREELARCTAANVATYGKVFGYCHLNVTYEPREPGVPHPEGWFTRNQCYRNEADEAAVITRWRERTGR